MKAPLLTRGTYAQPAITLLLPTPPLTTRHIIRLHHLATRRQILLARLHATEAQIQRLRKKL